MQLPMFRFEETFANARAVLTTVDYLRRLAKLEEDDTDRLTVIEGLGAIAVIFAGSISKWRGSPTCSLSGAEAFHTRQHAAYDIVDEVVAVANAQLVPLLAAGPKFDVPKRSNRSGAASFGSCNDPVQDAMDEASVRALKALPLVEFALGAGAFFPPDKHSGKFFNHLLAHKPVDAGAFTSALKGAFDACERG
jgi:hypothetical protein